MITNQQRENGYVARKIFHVLINLPLAVLIYTFPGGYLFMAALAGLLAVAIFEIARLKTVARKYVQEAIEPMLKKEERLGLTTVFWVAVAVLLLSVIVDPISISYGFFVFAIADPAAALIGKYTKSPRLYRQKTLNGSLAFLSMALLVTMTFFLLNAMLYPYIALSLAFALILALVEMFSYPLDDNVTVLVMGAGLMEFFLRFI